MTIIMFKNHLKHRHYWVITLLAAIVFFSNRCVSGEKPGASDTVFENFAGSSSCQGCHKEIYESHLETLHHLTSDTAIIEKILGYNHARKNSFVFHPGLFINVEEQGGQLHQVAYQNGVAKISRPFDYVIGSGKKGQSYLYWLDDYLFQLPLTYFTATNEWTNSPGYVNKVQFNRPITSRCLECHTTYFKTESPGVEKTERFSRAEVILGVECEKCHGAAKGHINYHQANDDDKKGRYIVNPSKLTRAQNLDLCRLCHGGSLSKSQPSFSFTAGDKLSDFFSLDSSIKNASDIDVHGNQFGLLSASKCFTNSDLTCTSCHSAHKKESGQLDLYVSRCINCHQQPHGKVCALTDKQPENFLRQNCIDCHMPKLPSRAITVLREGDAIPTSAMMRTHYIGIYKDEIRKILQGDTTQLNNNINR